MTEAEWLAATDPRQMAPRLSRFMSQRKIRLFGCACCRRAWEVGTEQVPIAIEITEAHADTQADDSQLLWAHQDASQLRAKNFGRLSFAYDSLVQITRPDNAAGNASQAVAYAKASKHRSQSKQWFTCFWDELAQHMQLLRDIIGNPFCPIAINPTWLTSDVRTLAEGIYQDRAFDRMPILADALQDAGCDNETVLAHCRQLGEHVRGCWVVDLLTGRK